MCTFESLKNLPLATETLIEIEFCCIKESGKYPIVNGNFWTPQYVGLSFLPFRKPSGAFIENH
jgi:hypothetical protein